MKLLNSAAALCLTTFFVSFALSFGGFLGFELAKFMVGG